MKCLLDTHSLVWFLEANPKLTDEAKQLIEDTNTICFVSTATFWEIAIKVSLGKLMLKIPFEELENWVIQNKIHVLSINFEAIKQLSRLPFHHRDPFDRTLIAQALTENLTIISKEKLFDNYSVNRLW